MNKLRKEVLLRPRVGVPQEGHENHHTWSKGGSTLGLLGGPRVDGVGKRDTGETLSPLFLGRLSTSTSGALGGVQVLSSLGGPLWRPLYSDRRQTRSRLNVSQHGVGVRISVDE